MKHGNVNYLWEPNESQWHDMLRNWPRENLEKFLYDLSFSSGVLSGLEIVQATAPNLTVTVKKGRAAFRDTSTGLAKLIELENDFSLNLSSLLPVSTNPAILLVVCEALSVDALPTQVVSPPPTLSDGSIHEDYDAAFQTLSFNRLTYDSATIKAVGSSTGQQVVLGSVVLSAGQTSILNSHIQAQNTPSSPREIAAPDPEIQRLKTELEILKPLVSPVGGILEFVGALTDIPSGWLPCDGRKLQQASYPKLFDLLGLRFSTVGLGNPNTDVNVGEFRLPDLSGRFSVAVGGGYNLGDTGGANSVTLTTAQMPQHDHPVTISGVGDHTHTITVNDHASPGIIEMERSGFTLNDPEFWVTQGTGVPAPTSSLALNHSATASNSGGHTHSVDVDNSGGGQSHENRPPFFAVYKIMRVS